MAAAAETAAQRFARDYGNVRDDRRVRDLDKEKRARVARLYVAPDGTTPATATNTNP